MDERIKPGLQGRAAAAVTEATTAAQWNSGSLKVFSTPHMIGLMECAAVDAVEALLEPGQVTVGSSVNIKHVSASPLGSNIWATAKLIEVDRRRLVFEVAAGDDWGEIGGGTHERFIVESARFMEKTHAKSSV
ncbi:MAG: hotdog domain-containing protein [Bacillota bacterium]